MKLLLKNKIVLMFGLLFVYFTTTAEFCETLSNLGSKLPEISATDSDGETIGRVCDPLEGGGQICTNSLKDGSKTETTYDADGKIIKVHLIAAPKNK